MDPAIEWLANGLKKEGKSGAGLARALGVDPSQITRLLKGERRFQVSEIRKAAVYLGEAAPEGILRATTPKGYAGTPEFLAAGSTSAAFIEELARAGVEPKLIGKAYDALAAARVEGAMEQRQKSQEK